MERASGYTVFKQQLCKIVIRFKGLTETSVKVGRGKPIGLFKRQVSPVDRQQAPRCAWLRLPRLSNDCGVATSVSALPVVAGSPVREGRGN